jgi:hypothetical protein
MSDDEHIKLALIENCQKCQATGGPLGKVEQGLADVLAILNERKGEKAVWSKITAIGVPVMCALLAAFMQYKFTQFRQLQEDVARRLKESQDHTTLLLDRTRSVDEQRSAK